MPVLILALILLLPVAFLLLLPLSLVQRYRVGPARRMARAWVATLNLALLCFSAVVFIIAAAITSVWIPETLRYAIAGLAVGVALGLLGLKWTRWEPAAGGLHYTPPRLLVLLITCAVALRVLYGIARAWRAWHDPAFNGSWLSAAGAAGSLGVGGIVLGYYLTYSAGLSRRVKGRGYLKVISVS